MSEPIKVGDLVMVVKPTRCCANAATIGRIFRVEWIGSLRGECDWCGHEGDPELGADHENDPYGGGYVLTTLKRIPPLEELQTWRQTEETGA